MGIRDFVLNTTALFRPQPKKAYFRSIEAASGGRRMGGIGTFHEANAEIGAAAHVVAARAKFLVANNGLVGNAVGNHVAELIAEGVQPAPIHDDEALRKAWLTRWNKWTRGSDADGLTNFEGQQADAALSTVVAGEFVGLLVDAPDGLKIRQLDPEQLDRSLTRELDNGYVVQGVEFDAEGRRVAYHILPRADSSAFGASWATPDRVDAADVIHVFKPLFPGQVRGLSGLTAIVLTASELDKLCDAMLMGAQVAAMHAGFITNSNELGDGSDPYAGEAVPTLEPGTLVRLKGGQGVTFSSPQQSQNAAELLKVQIRQLAAGIGVPTFMVDGDLSQANYSSLRAGLLPYRRRNSQFIYGRLVPMMLDRVALRWQQFELLMGTLPVDEPLACNWIAPAPWQVDPQKAVDADVAEIDAGLASRREKVAARGWAVEDVDADRAADAAREKALGLEPEPVAAPPGDPKKEDDDNAP